MVEHPLRKRKVVGSIPAGGKFLAPKYIEIFSNKLDSLSREGDIDEVRRKNPTYFNCRTAESYVRKGIIDHRTSRNEPFLVIDGSRLKEDRVIQDFLCSQWYNLWFLMEVVSS